ncbi:hypothetical protein HGA13_32220 [Nocardia speluncae]|uniref:Uncharacterized protein n=1 Tax=Nocardia speluncae TaxID=419477 RepID=A0A846XSB0_9NOCA|nr:hypothetical protein [Nocardia speluncae]NKY37700.1 hypothetical protein [Nocardia speluncae]
MSAPEPGFDITRGDAAGSRHLDYALRILSKHAGDPALKAMSRDVLSGNLGARDFVRTDQISAALDTAMPALMKRVEALSEQERERLAEQGDGILDRYLRENPDLPVPEPAPIAAEPANDRRDPPSSPESSYPTTTTQLSGNRRQSWRDVIVTPDEPDEDDLYFQERRERGWLQ